MISAIGHLRDVAQSAIDDAADEEYENLTGDEATACLEDLDEVERSIIYLRDLVRSTENDCARHSAQLTFAYIGSALSQRRLHEENALARNERESTSEALDNYDGAVALDVSESLYGDAPYCTARPNWKSIL